MTVLIFINGEQSSLVRLSNPNSRVKRGCVDWRIANEYCKYSVNPDNFWSSPGACCSASVFL